jgi:hypothetical protein
MGSVGDKKQVGEMLVIVMQMWCGQVDEKDRGPENNKSRYSRERQVPYRPYFQQQSSALWLRHRCRFLKTISEALRMSRGLLHHTLYHRIIRLPNLHLVTERTKYDPLSTTVVRGCDCTESFLAGCILQNRHHYPTDTGKKNQCTHILSFTFRPLTSILCTYTN